MAKILILTHGNWGQQLVQSLTMIIGGIEGVATIALMPSDTLDEFSLKVRETVASMPAGSLILTDFIGGTTSNVAARLSIDYPIGVICGLNATLLIEAIDRMTQGNLMDWVPELVQIGKASCKDVVSEMKAVTAGEK